LLIEWTPKVYFVRVVELEKIIIIYYPIECTLRACSDWTAKGGGVKLHGFKDDDELYTQRQEDDIQLTNKGLKHSATGNGWIHPSI